MISILFYIYFGCPILLLLISIFKDRYLKIEKICFPNISLFIAVSYEKKATEGKIKNISKFKYQKNKLKIIVFSNSSTDEIDKIVKKV